MAKTEQKKTKTRAKPDFTCKTCGVKFTSGRGLGKHYAENPDHRPEQKTTTKRKKKAKGAKRGPKPKAAATGYQATLSQAIAEIDADIKILNDKKKLLQDMLK